MNANQPVLDVRGLSVAYGDVEALRRVDVAVSPSEIVAVVGESGAGKSTLARAIGGLLDASGQAPSLSGQVLFRGVNLLEDTGQAARAHGDRITVALQGAALDPLMTVEDHLTEPFRARRRLRRVPREELLRLCEEVSLVPELLSRRPHELSGGQARQVSLAAALALDPEVVVLDEPTAGLDAATAHKVIRDLAAVVRHRGAATILITHDLPAASEHADRTVVLYAGQIIEQGTAPVVLSKPRHPYTTALLASVPSMTSGRDLHPIRGLPPDPTGMPSGCSFHPRCPQAIQLCSTKSPELDNEPHQVACHLDGVITRLQATELVASHGIGGRRKVALRSPGVSVRAGESVGIIGATGSGKSTLANVLGGALVPDEGTVSIYDPRQLHDEPWSLVRGKTDRSEKQRARSSPLPHERRRIQLVGQDPVAFFSPRWTVEQSLHEALDLDPMRRDKDPDAVRDNITRTLHLVGLLPTPRLLSAFPDEVSGGQLQRLGLARALLASPGVLIADEPTALLDPSEQARLAVVLRNEQIERGLSLLLVSHDLALIRRVTDRVYVLHEGRVVETGHTEEVYARPKHAATQALLTAAFGPPPPAINHRATQDRKARNHA